MAISLSTKSVSLSPTKSITRLFAFRFQSTLPSHPNPTDISDDSATDPLLRKLEDAIHRIIVRRAAPDWLPFVPGSSYWVPPRSADNGIAHLIEKLANPLTDEQTLSTTPFGGWPDSDYFLKGLPLNPLNTKTTSIESEAEAYANKSEAEASSDMAEVVAVAMSSNVPKSENEEG